MSDFLGSLAVPIFLTVAVACIAGTALGSRNNQKLPPGPKPLPVIGNILDIPKKFPYITFASWARLYGDIISLTVPGQVILVLNSYEVAKDVMEKKGAVFSDRPSIPFADMAGFPHNIVPLMPYGSLWRDGRHIMDASLRPSSIIEYQHLQRECALSSLRHIWGQPDKLSRHIRHFTASITTSIVYGYDLKSYDDHYLKLAEEVTSFQDYLLPGTLLVNHVPFLRHLPSWVPGAGFKSLTQRAKRIMKEMIDFPFSSVKNQMKAGTARPSLVSQTITELQDGADEKLVATVFGNIYLASVDTSSSTLENLFLALCLYPNAQRKAQAQIDQVVGRDRLPDFADRPSLPYVDALCQEVLRWKPVFPQGFPHSASVDIVHEGYFILKGSMIIANAWAMLQDPERFPNPKSFDPERFMTPDGKFSPDPVVSSAFGFGKRKCPGRHFADATIWIFVATLLAAMEISDARDEQGQKLLCCDV